MSQTCALFMSFLARLPLPLRASAVLVSIALISTAAYVGATSYPDYSIPSGPKAEERIAALFGLPLGADEHLVGDIAIERFYVLDPATGKKYVADMCKGQVAEVFEIRKDDGTVTYSVFLDRRNLKLESVQQLMAGTAPMDADVTYFGVKMQAGSTDVFAVNYGGRLPRHRAEFRSPRGETTYEFLAKFTNGDTGPQPRLFTNKDNNYLLNSTRNFSYFTTLFGIKDVVFVGQLLFVDATAGQSDKSAN